MCTLRIGWAELFLAANFSLVAGVLAVAFLNGWTIALIPGVTLALAVIAVYGIAKVYSREARESTRLDSAVSFEAVAARGRCQLARRVGDVFTVGPTGAVTPPLCGPAALVLRQAAAMEEHSGIREWCCPIYDHLLVFRRVEKAPQHESRPQLLATGPDHAPTTSAPGM
jgi:hypothetical protein